MHQTLYPSCLICGSPWKQFETESDRKLYNQCMQCGFIYLSPEFHPSPAQERARYLLHENTLENRGYVSYLNEIIEEWILPMASADSSILDFGSGPNPVFTQLLEQRGYKTALYDPFFAPHPTSLQKRYDLITLIEVVEHLDDPLSVLNRLAALLTVGGTLFISTLLYDNKTDFSAWWYRMDATHRGFFTDKTIYRIAQAVSCPELRISRGKFITMTHKKNVDNS